MKFRLVDNVRNWKKFGSVRLAMIAGAFAAVIAGNQSLALGLIYFLPEGPWRIVVAGVIGLLVFVIPTMARLVKKEPTDGKD